MFNRLELLLPGKSNLLQNTSVLVLGLGGVGGYALESIVRSGIGEVTIVDADKIDITNLNRQIVALQSTIGEYKTDAFAKRLYDINPNLIIHKVTKHITKDNLKELFINKIDYIIDCCDDIKVKEGLISYSVKNNIKLISSMGTGNKLHPERLKIMKLKDTNYDPIAKRLRKYVKEQGIKQDIFVVCSDEQKVIKEYKEMPSNAFVPAVAGLLCTSHIINDLVK